MHTHTLIYTRTSARVQSRFSSWYTCSLDWSMLSKWNAFSWIIRTKAHNTVRWATNFAKWILIEKVLANAYLLFCSPSLFFSIFYYLFMFIFFFFNQCNENWNFSIFSSWIFFLYPANARSNRECDWMKKKTCEWTQLSYEWAGVRDATHLTKYSATTSFFLAANEIDRC